ncbi:MAG: helix-turn-helix domain-containing protein [Paenibacillaceae bacterium]|nr:helix-turn-helix domain-containing protein [Paenibacillaceae bacterium]
MGIVSKYTSRFWVRLVFSYLILAVLIIGLFGGLLYTRANNMMVEEVSQSSKISLDTIRDYTERTFLPRFVETNKLMATINPDSAKETMFLLDNHYRDNGYLIPELNSSLKVAAYATPGTKNITFYYLKDRIVIDSNYFYESTDRSPDSEFVSRLADVPKMTWLRRNVQADNGTEYADSRVLTYVYTLPFMAEGDAVKGYMYIDVDVAYLENVLHTMLAPQLEKAYVFAPDGELLFSTAAAGDSQLSSLRQESGQRQPSFRVRTEDGVREVVSHSSASLSQLGWSYVIVRPMQSYFLSANKFKDDIINGCILLLVLGVLCSYFLSQRFYMPVKRIVSYIRKQHADNIAPHTRNEYAIIDNVLHSLDRRLNEQTRVSLVHHAIHGNIEALADGRLFPADSCCIVAVVRTDGGAEAFKRRHQAASQAVRSELVCMNADEIVILFYLPGEDNKAPGAAVRAFVERLRTARPEEAGFSCGFGRPAFAEEDVHLSYKQALHALKYTFLYGMNVTIGYDQIDSRRGFGKKFAYDGYQNALRAADAELVETFLADFSRELGREDLQIEVVEFEIMQLITRLSHTIIELDLHEAVISSTDLFSEFKKSTLAETLDWLRHINTAIMDRLRVSSENPHYAIIHDLKAYIDTHLEEDISLDSLAERAYLSPSYISSLFGEILHVSFSTYLTNARVDKAAELLRGSTLTVTDITTAVGYHNIQYFCRKFKEKYGVTPMQYRKSATLAPEQLLTPESG